MQKYWNYIVVLIVTSSLSGFAQEDAFSQIRTLFTKDSTTSLPITVSGDARFFSVYRNMSQQYGDVTTGKKDLSFTSYPLSGVGSGNSAGIPLINLQFKATPVRNFEFDVAYSFSHDFNGLLDDTSKVASVRSNLNFGAQYKTDFGVFKMIGGGGVLWTHLSPLTMYNLESKESEFNRLPWEHESNSFQRYQSVYDNASAGSGESYENVAFQGFVLEGQGLPYDFGFRALYGRSWTSVDQERAGNLHPANTVGARLEKYVQQHLVGFNYYEEFGDTDRVNRVRDRRSIYTTEIRLNYGKMKFNTEFGAGRVDNPLSNNKWSPGAILHLSFDKQITKLPLSVQLYNIGVHMASNVSSAYNSNINASAGGYNRDPKYDTQKYINVMEELGQYSNNRRGIVLKSEKSFGGFKIELGYGLSQEIENLHDTVLFQHRVNSFSRSRFNPWIQDSGPYGTIKSVFRRTYQTVGITDSSNYLKGFNTIDVVLKQSTQVLGRTLILKNYTSWTSVGKGIKAIPSAGEDAFVSTVFNQLTGFYQVSAKVALIGFGAIQATKANNATVLSPDNNKPVDQFGTGYGVGIDYDFGKNAGVFLRHKWMEHKDKNFVLDHFKGQETTLELKVFF